MSNKITVTTEPGTSILRVERVFNAPRENVFRVFTDAEKIKRWWSPGGSAVVEIDAREGGAWKFSEKQSDSNGVTFYGVFHEVSSPERIVQTSEFENLGERGHVVLEKYEFTDLGDGRTKLLLTDVFSSLEDLHNAVQSGMEHGLAQSYEKLDILLEEMN